MIKAYSDKLKKEEEGFELVECDEEDSSGKIIYVFRDEALLPKFKKVNSSLTNILQSFFVNTSSAIKCFAEYLEKEVIINWLLV